jgi:hypothetical protein
LIKFLVCNHKISKTKFEQDIMIEVDRFIRTEIILYVVDLIQSFSCSVKSFQNPK